uniref:Uncharacterized protein n=1 Tax=Panagrellus redivivus TaxID=6233 RepID=A0A7E4V279_PANRE
MQRYYDKGGVSPHDNPVVGKNDILITAVRLLLHPSWARVLAGSRAHGTLLPPSPSPIRVEFKSAAPSPVVATSEVEDHGGMTEVGDSGDLHTPTLIVYQTLVT